MKTVYFYMDVALALYTVAQGDTEEKLVNLRRWQKGFLNEREKAAVDGFIEGLPVRNPLLFWLTEKLAYVALRIGCLPTAPAEDAGLPLGIELSAVWARMKDHPLFSPCIELKRERFVETPRNRDIPDKIVPDYLTKLGLHFALARRAGATMTKSKKKAKPLTGQELQYCEHYCIHGNQTLIPPTGSGRRESHGHT